MNDRKPEEAYQMRIDGATYKQIAMHFGISAERARQLAVRGLSIKRAIDLLQSHDYHVSQNSSGNPA